MLVISPNFEMNRQSYIIFSGITIIKIISQQNVPMITYDYVKGSGKIFEKIPSSNFSMKSTR